ncbi:MAG: O-methyltransferase [Bacteroidia bacterium]
MNFLDSKLEQYIEHHTEDEAELLKKLNRDTYAHVLQPRMLSGHLQGRVLAMLSRMIKPSQILEIGTFTGYSALCLAEGLQKDGTLHTIDVNEELIDMVKKYVSESSYSEQIKIYTGEALKIIPTINYTFDLAFIDADKENYCNYFDLVIDKVRKGGYIIADNVLWSGNVIKPKNEQDDETESIVAYNKKVHEDKRVRNVLLPVRDGLMICEKL